MQGDGRGGIPPLIQANLLLYLDAIMVRDTRNLGMPNEARELREEERERDNGGRRGKGRGCERGSEMEIGTNWCETEMMDQMIGREEEMVIMGMICVYVHILCIPV